MIFLIRAQQRASFIKVGVPSLSVTTSVFRRVYKADNGLCRPGVIILKHWAITPPFSHIHDLSPTYRNSLLLLFLPFWPIPSASSSCSAFFFFLDTFVVPSFIARYQRVLYLLEEYWILSSSQGRAAAPHKKQPWICRAVMFCDLVHRGRCMMKQSKHCECLQHVVLVQGIELNFYWYLI